jgi:hypothetical protein
VGAYSCWTYGTSEGLGLRVWFFDSLAFDARVRYSDSIDTSEIRNASGDYLVLHPGGPAIRAGTSGAVNGDFGITWSGF